MQPLPVAANGGGRSLAPLAQQPAVKAVHVYRNGDPFYRGRRMLIHEKRVGSFDIFLKDVTSRVQAPFGAVRNIYTPKHGHRVTELEELHPGESYVAGGRENFKKLDYLNIGENKKKPADPMSQSPTEDDADLTGKSHALSPSNVKPVSHSRINVSARFRKNFQEPCTVFLIANGDIMNPVVRLLIPRKVLDQWELVLAMVTDKVKLRNGAVHRLYTLEGIPINDGSELENGQFYVAVGRDKFKKLPYNDLIFTKSSVRRAQGSKASSLPPINGYRKSKENRHERHSKSTGGSADTVNNLASPQPPKDSSSQKEHLKAKGKTNPEPQMLNKPVRVKEKNEINNNVVYQEDDDGIFKAGEDRSEMWGASEVQEDENTKVEVPVDQRVAETVEEEVRNNEGQDDDDEEAVEKAEQQEEDLNNGEEDLNNGEEDLNNGEEDHIIEEQTGQNEEHSMAEYSIPRPTSSRLLEKVSTPSEGEKEEQIAVA